MSAAGLLLVFAALGNVARFSEPAPAGALGVDGVRVKLPGGEVPAYVDEPIDPDFLDVLGAKEVTFRTYETIDNAPVWIFIGYFDRQKTGSQVHSPKHCYPGSGWSILSEENVPAPWGTGEIKALVVSDGVEKRVVHYWYQTPGRMHSDVIGLKFYLTRNAVMRKTQDVVFVRVSTPLKGNFAESSAKLRRYSMAVKKEIDELYRVQHETG